MPLPLLDDPVKQDDPVVDAHPHYHRGHHHVDDVETETGEAHGPHHPQHREAQGQEGVKGAGKALEVEQKEQKDRRQGYPRSPAEVTVVEDDGCAGDASVHLAGRGYEFLEKAFLPGIIPGIDIGDELSPGGDEPLHRGRGRFSREGGGASSMDESASP